MKQEYSIASDGSWLSIAQAKICKDRILSHFPELTINIEDIQDEKADFTIESLEPFAIAHLDNTPHAFIQRGDIRNSVFFNKNTEAKLRCGEQLTIAIDKYLPIPLFEKFLQRGLPKYGTAPVNIKFVPTENTLESLIENSLFDGIIVALAHLNNLLSDAVTEAQARSLLKDKKWMVLPLFECPPLVGQGTIIATTTIDNTDAVSILKKCNDQTIETAIKLEQKIAAQLHDTNNLGAFYLDTGTTKFTFATGINTFGKQTTKWDFELPDDLQEKEIFSSTDYMKDFFTYEFLNDASIDNSSSAVFISSHKALHPADLENAVSQKRVWAAGTRTWYELAKKGIWVEGCADGLGLEFLKTTWQSPLLNLQKEDIQIITNASSTTHWKADGWNTAATYELIPSRSDFISEAINKAQFVFWTSFQQYELYKDSVQKNALHGCPAGKTAKLLLAEGLQPIIFPTIKAFLDWYSCKTNQ